MGLFNKKEKEEALENLKRVQQDYEELGLRVRNAAQKLYVKRKEAVEVIESAENILKRQPDFSIEYIKRIANARASIRLFTEAMLNENRLSGTIDDPTGKYARAAIAGTATGAAVAALGPSAAMAVATTFGTAATGTAISTLSGAAATNAALAWLGGGALAVGGGGMAAGSAILALFGPVGLTIGAVTAGVTSLNIRNKNGKIADAANKMAKEMSDSNKKLRSAIHHIEQLNSEISLNIDSINKYMDKITPDDSVKGTHSDYYKYIVVDIEELCGLINEEIDIL